MPTINIFSGGIATDVIERRTDTFAMSKGFDTWSQDRLITHYGTEEITTQEADCDLTDAIQHTDSAGNTAIWALGKYGSPAYARLYKLISDRFDLVTGAVATSSGAPIAGTLVTYGTDLVYCTRVTGSSTSIRVYKYNPATDTTTALGTIDDYNAVMPKPFVHSTDSILYIAVGNIIASYNGSSFVASAKTIPDTSMVATSLTSYGTYLAIACAPKTLGGRSKVLLWGRDVSLSTFQEVIDYGEGALMILENIGGSLVGVSGVILGGIGSTYVTNPKLIIRGYAGGSAEEIKIVPTDDVLYLGKLKAKNGNKLYFPMGAVIQGETVYCLWVLGKNRDGEWFLSPDRILGNATTGVSGFSMIGDTIWVGQTDGKMVATDINAIPASTYVSLVNHSMAIEDRDKLKKLESISISTMLGGSMKVYYKAGKGEWVEVMDQNLDENTTFIAFSCSDGIPFGDAYDFQFKVVTASDTEVKDITSLRYKHKVI